VSREHGLHCGVYIVEIAALVLDRANFTIVGRLVNIICVDFVSMLILFLWSAYLEDSRMKSIIESPLGGANVFLNI